MVKTIFSFAIILLVASSALADDDFSTKQLYDREELARNSLDDLSLEYITTQIFSGDNKIATCDIQIKRLSDSIRNLADLGTDLDTYVLEHRGIICQNLVPSNSLEVPQIFLRIDDSTNIIPYRFLRSSLDCIEDPFLGYACNAFFKKGPSEDDFNTILSFSFGNCQKGVDLEQVRNFETIMEVLITSHKNTLEYKIRNADSCAGKYEYYQNLYDSTINAKDLNTQIPALKKKLDEKNAECANKERELNDARAAYDNEKAKFDANTEKITALNNNISSLTAQKQAYEVEQVQRMNAARTFETRQAEVNAQRESLCRLVNTIVTDIDPNFFEGRTCCNNDNGFDDFCIQKLNSFN